MRTIKFRAWDKESRRFLNGDFSLGIESGEFRGKYGEVFTNIDISQFTGLHDKNGKEIYEGDILKTFPIISSDKTSYDSFNVVVRFTSSSWIANGVLGFRQAEISEVIGNIYENPELLTD